MWHSTPRAFEGLRSFHGAVTNVAVGWRSVLLLSAGPARYAVRMLAFVRWCLIVAVVLTGVAQAATAAPEPSPTGAASATAAPKPSPSAAVSATAAPKPAPAAATAVPKPAPSATPNPRLAGIAPADNYFGPFGMSPLSIRSTIGLLGREYHQRTISDRDLLRKALITEDALRIWRKKYPADPWLTPTFFHLEQLYQAVQTQEARKHATAILKDIVLNYAASKEGHLSRSRLAAGFPALVPESPLAATPAPTMSPEVPSPEAPSAPASSASAVPASAGTSLPSAAAASTPGPTPSSSRTPR